MEAVECGAAALGIVLGYYGLFVPLEELRVACGVSRDGSKASNLVAAARRYGLNPKAYRKEPEQLPGLPLPMIVFWEFNHFLVVEGFGPGRVYLNDPAVGHRVVTMEEFDQSFTGIVITFEPTPAFQKGRKKPTLAQMLAPRLRGSQTALAYVVLTSLALVVPGLALPAFTKVFVDQVLVNEERSWFVPLLVGMGLTAVVRGLLASLQQRHLLRLETKMALTSSSRFLWHVLRLPMEFYTHRFAGDIASRVSLNDRVARLLSGELATNVFSLMMIVFYAVVMLHYDVLLTVTGVLIALFNFAALRYVSRARTDTNARLSQERGKLEATSVGGLYMIETLKATGSEGDFFTRWSGQYAKVVNAEQERGTHTHWLMALPPLLSALNTAAILCLGGLRVMDGALTIGSLVAFQSLMASFLEPVNRLVFLGSRLQEAHTDLERLNDVLQYPAEPNGPYSVEPDHGQPTGQPHANEPIGVLSKPGPHARPAARAQEGPEVLPFSEVPAKLSGRLELRHVTFGYSRLEPPLIEDFNLRLEPGSRVALVGPTGSGKSTVARLVAGLYQPWQGEVLFDGIPRSRLPRRVITNSLAFVDQEIFLFEGTVRDNLTLWDNSIPEIQLIQAARDAAILEEITARPGGFDSWVEEGGRNFSGGQRQRLEIARALAQNPAILVLDEATSALDPVTEAIIDDHLRRRGCTCLIVAHRLSTIRDCDEIIVMDRGKVVQRGTHDDLKHADGPYRELIRLDHADPRRGHQVQSLLERLL